MYNLVDNPIKEIPFGTAMKVSLDHYYDLLKQQAGSLGSKEYLQLKLVADGLDITPSTSQGSYKWFSYYNLLNRSDVAINHEPINDVIFTGAKKLADVYGRFLRRLRNLIVLKELSDEDHHKLDSLDLSIDRKREIAMDLTRKDQEDWRRFCEIRGIDTTDIPAYVQWSSRYGQMAKIEEVFKELSILTSKKKEIIYRALPNQEDMEVIETEIAFDNPFMKLRYPTHPDFEYLPTILSLVYLATLTPGSTSIFDDRHMLTWDKTLDFIKTTQMGKLNATFSKSNSENMQIEKDWGASANARYGFIKVKASASESKKIVEDFNTATSITLKSESSVRLNIKYGRWFNANLFNHPRVLDNPDLFNEFFGFKGSLLYYPVALVLVRGFGISFENSSNWTYDYQKKFSAAGGGGFRAFGINFGGSSRYKKSYKEHKVSKSATELSIQDDKDTIRFVGYVVKKNDAFINNQSNDHENFFTNV